MQAAVWKDFPYYRKFETKFDGNAEVIVSALEKHYSNDGGFDGFFNDWHWLEEEQHMSEDQILETMKEKADIFNDRKAAAFFEQGMKNMAKARGIGEKGLASILDSVYMESDDRRKHLMRNYMQLMESGEDKPKMDNLIMERYGPKDPENGSSWWGKVKKYGKKPLTWAAVGVIAAGIVSTCYVKKLGEHETREHAAAKIERKIQPAAQETESLCQPKFKKLTYVSKGNEVILPMPEGSHRDGARRNYKVVLPGDIQRGKDGISRVRIRQNVKPHTGVDAIGILSENGWMCGKAGEYITVELTPRELGKYMSGEGANLQVAALKNLSDGVYQSMGSYRNLFLKK